MFGVVLMAAGVARMIEISFVLQDAPRFESRPGDEATVTASTSRSFQHLTPFVSLLFTLHDSSSVNHIPPFSVIGSRGVRRRSIALRPRNMLTCAKLV